MSDLGHSSPKTEPLRGALVAEYKTCGKPSCRCARGERHGPYWRRYWREAGRRRRSYTRAADLDEIAASVAEWRRLHPPARSTRELLAELRRLMRQLDVLEV